MPTVPNYTDAQVKTMHEKYDPTASQEVRDAVVDALAIEFGKNKRSIRSKLVNEKIFVKKASVSKVTGGEAMKKDAMASNLVAVSGVNTDSEGKETHPNAESIAKMNKTDIQFFTTKLVDTSKVMEAMQETIYAYRDEFGELPEPETEGEPENS